MMTQPQTGTNRFRLKKRVVLVTPLVIVILVAVSAYVYYSMSVASVTRITLDQIQAVRIFGAGTYPNRNVTYILEVQVWSKAQTLDVSLNAPTFLADADAVPLGNQTLADAIIIKGAYLTYNLRFSINESKVIGPNPSASNMGLRMVSWVGAGFYSRTVTLSTSTIWNWTTAKLIVSGGCFDITFNIGC